MIHSPAPNRTWKPEITSPFPVSSSETEPRLIFTEAFASLSQVRLEPPAGARNRRKATAKKQTNVTIPQIPYIRLSLDGRSSFRVAAKIFRASLIEHHKIYYTVIF